MKLLRSLFSVFLSLLIAVSPVAAQAPAALSRIGVAAAVSGQVRAFASTPPKRGEAVGRIVSSGLPLYLNEKITTGPGARLQIMLLDETVFTIGPNSTMMLDKFVYDPATNSGTVSASIIKGVFRFITGRVGHKNPSSMNVKFPVGTMGIRGTIVAGYVGASGATTAVLLGPGPANSAPSERIGAFTLANNAGASVDVNRPGFGTRIDGIGAVPSAPALVPSNVLSAIQGALGVRPSQAPGENSPGDQKAAVPGDQKVDRGADRNSQDPGADGRGRPGDNAAGGPNRTFTDPEGKSYSTNDGGKTFTDSDGKTYATNDGGRTFTDSDGKVHTGPGPKDMGPGPRDRGMAPGQPVGRPDYDGWAAPGDDVAYNPPPGEPGYNPAMPPGMAPDPNAPYDPSRGPGMPGAYDPAKPGAYDPSRPGAYNPAMPPGGHNAAMPGGYDPAMMPAGYNPAMPGGAPAYAPGMMPGGYNPAMPAPDMMGGGLAAYTPGMATSLAFGAPVAGMPYTPGMPYAPGMPYTGDPSRPADPTGAPYTPGTEGAPYAPGGYIPPGGYAPYTPEGGYYAPPAGDYYAPYTPGVYSPYTAEGSLAYTPYTESYIPPPTDYIAHDAYTATTYPVFDANATSKWEDIRSKIVSGTGHYVGSGYYNHPAYNDGISHVAGSGSMSFNINVNFGTQKIGGGTSNIQLGSSSGGMASASTGISEISFPTSGTASIAVAAAQFSNSNFTTAQINLINGPSTNPLPAQGANVNVMYTIPGSGGAIANGNAGGGLQP